MIENKDKISAKAARYYKENREYVNERNSNYYRNNKEAHRVRTFNTYARRKNADGYVTKEDLDFLRYLQDNKCIYCLTDLSTVINEVDHQVSIANGGSNNLDNLAITCRTCNRSKGPRNHDEHVRYLSVAHPELYDNYINNSMEVMPLYYSWLEFYASQQLLAA